MPPVALPARPAKDEPVLPYNTRWAELRIEEVAREVAQDIGFAPTFKDLRWTRALWDLRAGVPRGRMRVKLGYSKLGWEVHALPALLPFVPDGREGEMPTAT